jgi:hypothetical protein
MHFLGVNLQVVPIVQLQLGYILLRVYVHGFHIISYRGRNVILV